MVADSTNVFPSFPVFRYSDASNVLLTYRFGFSRFAKIAYDTLWFAGDSCLLKRSYSRCLDRDGNIRQSKQVMIRSWGKFFEMVPKYRNTFTRVESDENLVVILGYAYWSEEQPYDPVIWTATIVNDLVREWRIYADSEENRRGFNLLYLPNYN